MFMQTVNPRTYTDTHASNKMACVLHLLWALRTKQQQLNAFWSHQQYKMRTPKPHKHTYISRKCRDDSHSTFLCGTISTATEWQYLHKTIPHIRYMYGVVFMCRLYTLCTAVTNAAARRYQDTQKLRMSARNKQKRSNRKRTREQRRKKKKTERAQSCGQFFHSHQPNESASTTAICTHNNGNFYKQLHGCVCEYIRVFAHRRAAAAKKNFCTHNKMNNGD